jgi:putative membrane protein
MQPAMSSTTASPTRHFEVHTTSDSHFSWIRTRLAVERTLMAWIRTATALIGFGFTIVQFFERFSDMQGVAAAARPDAPRYLGLALIGAGVLGAAIALWQYSYLVKYMFQPDFQAIAGIKEGRMALPAAGAAIVVLLIGIFAFGAVAMRFV